MQSTRKSLRVSYFIFVFWHINNKKRKHKIIVFLFCICFSELIVCTRIQNCIKKFILCNVIWGYMYWYSFSLYSNYDYQNNITMNLIDLLINANCKIIYFLESFEIHTYITSNKNHRDKPRPLFISRTDVWFLLSWYSYRQDLKIMVKSYPNLLVFYSNVQISQIKYFNSSFSKTLL